MIAFLNGGTFEGNTILSPNSINEMLSFQIPSLNATQGLNWYQEPLYHSSGQEMLWCHSGGEQGVNTHLFIDPQNDLGLCVLTNGEGDGLYICDDLYDYALNMVVNNSIAPDCISTVGTNNLVMQKEKNLVKIIDFMGRETSFKPNTPLIYIYSDGTRERVMKLEE